MRMLRLSMGFVPVLMVFLMVGCNIFPKRVEQPIHYFDIGSPTVKPKLKMDLKLASVNSLFSERTQMLLKKGANTVLIDEYNRWSDLPSALLRRYFVELLSGSEQLREASNSSSDTVYALNLEIVRFDFNLTKGVANVTVLCVVNNSRSSKTVFRCVVVGESKIQTETGSGCAKAMSAAVSDMAARLFLQLNSASFNSGSKK